MNNEFEAQLKALLYSQQPENINLAVESAKAVGVDLKALIKSWGLNPFGIVEAEDFLKTKLYCSYNQIKDLSPLAGLSRLEWLDCNGNQIKDLSPLAGLSRLERLDCGKNQIKDLSPIQHLIDKGLQVYK